MVNNEEVLRELHQYFVRPCKTAGSIFVNKFLYMFTRDTCFSHYITFYLFFLQVTDCFWMTCRGRLRTGVACQCLQKFICFFAPGYQEEKTEINMMEKKSVLPE